jgi:hypothetical protein
MDQASSATVDAPRRWTGVVRLPEEDPGVPDTRSPARLLLWVGRHQIPTLVAGVLFGILWMVAQSLMPFAIGQAIEDGIVNSDNRALAAWALVLLALGAVQAGAGIMRHRYAVFNWLQASFRMAQVVSHHSARSGPAVRGRLSTGEVVATVSNDAMRAGGAFDITARLSGSIVAYVVVAFILLSASVVLGLIVLIGVPVLVLLLGFVIKPLQERQRDQREEVGKLTALSADTAAGLRAARSAASRRSTTGCHHRSQEVRYAGVRVAPAVDLDAAGLRPGLFVVLVTWLGARFAVSGRSTSATVVLPGYAAFLVPSHENRRGGVTRSRAFVGARRMLTCCRRADVADPESPPTSRRRASAEDERSASWSSLAHHLHRLFRRTSRGRSRTASGGSEATACLGRDSRGSLLDRRPPRIVVSEADLGPLARTALGARSVGAGDGRRDPPGDLRRERRGRRRRAARAARGRHRRARPLVLRWPAAAPCPHASAPGRPGDPRPRRADERGRRSHRVRSRAGSVTPVRADDQIAATSPLALDQADKVVPSAAPARRRGNDRAARRPADHRDVSVERPVSCPSDRRRARASELAQLLASRQAGAIGMIGLHAAAATAGPRDWRFLVSL